MYEDKTAEKIQEELVAAAEEAGWSCEEGTLAALLVAPMATALADYYQQLIAMIPKFWVDGTSGIYIEAAANVLGLYRKEGSCASCSMSFWGTTGTVISAGTLFLTSDGLSFGLDFDVTLDDDGLGSGTATAQGTGSAYNIDAGEIVSMYVNLSGLTSYTNEAALGGSDVESDDALYLRLDTARTSPATSGNVSAYQQWALEVAGVGYAKITPLVSGAGTVGVVLASAEGAPVSDDIVATCAAHIETVRPIGASVTVASATGLDVAITATIQIDSTTTVSTVQTTFVSDLDTYLAELVDTWTESTGGYTLLYNRVLSILMSVDGVVDVTELTINDASGNVSLTAAQVPQLGEVTLSADD